MDLYGVDSLGVLFFDFNTYFTCTPIHSISLTSSRLKSLCMKPLIPSPMLYPVLDSF